MKSFEKQVKDQIAGLWFMVIALILILVGVSFSLGREIEALKSQSQIQEQEQEIALTFPRKTLKATTFDFTEPEQVFDKHELEGWQEFIATAYCGCAECNGEWSTNGHAVSATGAELTPHRSIAADFSVLPAWTDVEIYGMGLYEVHDCGGAIKGNRIDIYFDSHEEANEFGVQKVMLRVADND